MMRYQKVNIFICSSSHHLFLTILSLDKSERNILYWDINRSINYTIYLGITDILIKWFDEIILVKYDKKITGITGKISAYNNSRHYLKYLKSLIQSDLKLTLFIHSFNLLERRFINCFLKFNNKSIILVEDGLGSYLSISEIFGYTRKFRTQISIIIKQILKINITTDKISKFLVWKSYLVDEEIKNVFKEKLQDIVVKEDNLTELENQLKGPIFSQTGDSINTIFFNITDYKYTSEFYKVISSDLIFKKDHPDTIQFNRSKNSLDSLPWEFFLLSKNRDFIFISSNSTTSYSFLISNRNLGIKSFLVYKLRINPYTNHGKIDTFFNKLRIMYPENIFIIDEISELNNKLNLRK